MPSDGRYYFKACFDVSQVKWKTYLIPDLILLFINLDFQESHFFQAACIYLASVSWGVKWSCLTFLSGRMGPGPRPFWSRRRRARYKSKFPACKVRVNSSVEHLSPSLLAQWGNSSSLQARRVDGWRQKQAGEAWLHLSWAPPDPGTTPDMSGRGSVWCLSQSQKPPSPHLEPNSTLLSCGISSKYGGHGTGFHSAFV